MALDDLKTSLITEVGNYMSTKFPEMDLEANLDSSFSGMGLDSLGHVELSGVVENVIGTAVQPDIAFNYPTVNALVNRALYLKMEAEHTEQEVENASG